MSQNDFGAFAVPVEFDFEPAAAAVVVVAPAVDAFDSVAGQSYW